MKELIKQTILNALSIERIINPSKKIRIFRYGGIINENRGKRNIKEIWERQFESMPQELIVYMVKNNILYPSPYNIRYAFRDSGSYYDTPNKRWDYTPENSLRVSDHWNFYTNNKDYETGIETLHLNCETDIPVENNTQWVVAKYIDNIYKVIAIYPKIYTIREKREKRMENNYYTSLLEEIRKNAEGKMNEKRAKIWKEKLKERDKKMKEGKIFVSFERNIWGGTRKHLRIIGTEKITGILNKETPHGITVNGKNYRQYKNYKETIK